MPHNYQDKTRQDKTRQDKTRQDKTRQDKTRQTNYSLNSSVFVKSLFSAFLIFIFTACLPVLTKPASADSNWWNYSWGWKKQLTFNNTSSNLGVTPENLSNFPILVKLTSSNFDFGKAQSSGQDIRFIDSDNSTQLSYEIEKWDATNQQAFIWVKVPQVDASSADYIYMYYGNPTATDAQSASNAWNSNFKGVWHLKEDPSVAAPQALDSTSNDNDGTSNGSMTSSDQVTGQIDGSLDFDGSNDYISAISNSSLEPSAALTLEAWIKSTANGFVQVVGKGRDVEANKFGLWTGGVGGDGTNRAMFRMSDSSNVGYSAESSNIFQTGTWYHVVGVWDGSSMNLYINGELKNNISASFTRTTNTRSFYIGAHVIVSLFPFNGVIDEVRLSDVARSAAWVAADYKSGNDVFVSYSGESITPAGQSLGLSTSIGSGNNGKSRISGSVSSGNSSFIISNVECLTNGGGFGGATATDSSFNSTSEDFYYDFLSSDNAWTGEGYTIRCRATRAGGTVIDNLFYFSPFNQNEPAGNTVTNSTAPTFDFGVIKQKSILKDNLSKYQIQVRKGGSDSTAPWETIIDDIPIDGTLDTTGTVIVDNDNFKAVYSDDSSRIKVYSKKKQLAGSMQWKVVAVDKSGHSQDSGTRSLRISTTNSATTSNFPLAILNISGLGNPNISTANLSAIKDTYRLNSLNPIFYGIAFTNAKVTLSLTDQDCISDCTKTYSTVANPESRFGINIPKGDLKWGKKYTANMSVAYIQDYNELPTFTLSTSGVASKPKATPTPEVEKSKENNTTQQSSPTPIPTPQPIGGKQETPKKNCFLFFCF